MNFVFFMWLNFAIKLIIYSLIFVMPNNNYKVNSQSTCNFMAEIPRLKLLEVPFEPEPRNVLYRRDAEQIRYCNSALTLNKRTCCTAKIEAQMEKISREDIEISIKNQIKLLKGFFNLYSIIFERHIKTALQITQSQLDALFTQTYGYYYTSNAHIFHEFFEKVENYFNDSNNLTNSNILSNLLNELFQQIYITEYSLFNPLIVLNDKERKCLIEIKEALKPFGSLPKKITHLFSQSLSTWKLILYSLKEMVNELDKIHKKIKLFSQCSNSLMAMSKCHICNGEDPFLRPCSNYCINVFKGCFSEMAELNLQFNNFINSFFQLSDRLKNVYNPYNVLAPIPVQLSEAIMNFQEKKTLYTNRIQLRCFQTEFRFKRGFLQNYQAFNIDKISQPNDNSIAEKEFKKNLNDILKNYKEKNWHLFYQESFSLASLLKLNIIDFLDKLIRSKNFWSSIPRVLCEEGGYAAKYYEKCWNGTAVDAYRFSIVGDGFRKQKYNPEFQPPNSLNISDDSFLSQRLRFAVLSTQLNARYEGRELQSNELAEVNVEEIGISVDDEDSIEASGLPTENFNENLSLQNKKEKNSQQLKQKSYSKLFTLFKHPTTNHSVIVTRNLPSSAASKWNKFPFKVVSTVIIMFFVLI